MMNRSPQEDPIELVRAFRHRRILVIGDALLDSYLEGEASRLSRDGPVPVIEKTAEQRLPGGAANVAANLRALDADVYFLSIIGDDIAGTLLHEELRKRGISDRWLVSHPGIRTPHKLRILADGQHIARFDAGKAQNSLSLEECQQRILPHLETLYTCCDAVLCSDYCYGVLSEAMIERLGFLVEAHPKVVLVDSQALQRFHRFPATVVTPNRAEAQILVTQAGSPNQQNVRETEDLSGVRDLARHILDMLATEHIAITLAEQGVFLLNRAGQALHLPAHPITAVHDVGAGDSFASAFLLALASGGGIEEAARIGIDAAGIAVAKPRTAVVSHQELLQRVSLRRYIQAQQRNEKGVLQKLVSALEIEKLHGKKIVFTNGVFDILHAGHLSFLRQAKALGDVLVVAVNSDASARTLKGPGRPINSEQDRLALIEALDPVDYAVPFNEETAASLITQLKPHVYVKGGDYDESVPEAATVRITGAQLVILPLVGDASTSGMIERIIAQG